MNLALKGKSRMRTIEPVTQTNEFRSRSLRRGAGLLAAKLSLAAISVLGIAVGASSCSLVVDSNAAQCAADADCVGELAGRTCDTEKGLCVATVIPGDKCTTNAQCAEKGALFVCRKEKCVSLTNEQCTTIHTTKKVDADAYKDDDALIIGSITPSASTIYPEDLVYAVTVEDAIKLALDDFGKVNGIPAGTGGDTRPIVLVACNDGPNEDQYIAAAKHLVDDLGVPAIIGYPFSGSTLEIATEVTIPAGVLLFSPAATSNDITKLNDKDLVWRTSPPDSFQAAALTLYYPDVEARARKLFPKIMPADKFKVAILYLDESYGKGLADALQATLTFNGKGAAEQLDTNFKRISYGTSTSLDLSKVQDVVDFAPNVIFIFGNSEGLELFDPIEKNWKAQPDDHKPMWVFPDGGKNSALWDEYITSEEMRLRVSGSVPGVLGSTYKPYGTFLLNWSSSNYSKGDATQLGVAGAYDITYMLAYSAVALGTNPLTGANLAKLGLRKMVPGTNITKVVVGPGSGAIQDTFTSLLAGKSIDIEGTSGPLNFNEFGEAPSDVQIWCVPPGTGGKVASAAITSGLYLDSSLTSPSALSGALSADCALP